MIFCDATQQQKRYEIEINDHDLVHDTAITIWETNEIQFLGKMINQGDTYSKFCQLLFKWQYKE